jgi:hypothetical protein
VPRPAAASEPAAAAAGARASHNGQPAEPGAAAASDQPDRPRLDTRPPDEDAIDLLSVAGLPVLKRALPAAAAVLLLLIALVLRRRKRSAS